MGSLTLKHAYRDYVRSGGKLSYKYYRKVCSDYNLRVMDRVIYHAERFDMGAELSRLYVIRVERDYKRPAVNWNASHEYKEELLEAGETLYSKSNPEGKKWFVYYTDDWYYVFYWEKKFCKVKNKTAYRLDMTRGSKGNKEKLTEYSNDNDLAYLKYPLIVND